jgi:hypothetical protein
VINGHAISFTGKLALVLIITDCGKYYELPNPLVKT